MTEAEWLTCDDPKPMIPELVRLSDNAILFDRQVRLFCVACCRLIWDDLSYRLMHRFVHSAESFALGQISEEEFAKARNSIHRKRGRDAEVHDVVSQTIALSAAGDQWYTAQQRVSWRADRVRSFLISLWGSRRVGPAPPDATAPTHPWHLAFQAGVEEVNQLMADYLVCLVGNPFHPPPAFDPSWRTSTAVGLAEGIDADRAYDRMPILADALEDAGCDDASVLSHSRGAAHHTRGCWVVEAVLNRNQR